MITDSYIKYLLVDEESLKRYFVDNEYVSLDDIKRSLMLEERRNNIHIPDHHYRLGQEKTFETITLLSDIFTQGVRKLSEEYLECKKEEIFVITSKQTEWQLLLPYISPSLLIAIKLYYEFPAGLESPEQYISRYIIPNIRYTSLPSPHIPQMEEMRKRNHGFYDLHIHLNGTLETDIVWQDILRHPKEVYRELQLMANNEKVKEHFAQLSPFLSPLNFYKLINIARTLRYSIQSKITGVNLYQWLDFKDFLISVESLSGNIESVDNLFLDLDETSFDSRYIEVYFYIRVFDYMFSNPEDDFVASLFHYYLLILGQVNKLLVQQSKNFGFEEFQKHTLNGLREYSERFFYRRFFQLAGNCLNNISLLEGRFSPKDTLTQNQLIIDRIISAWEKLSTQQRELGLCNNSKLKLTAHFIKKKDALPNPFIRHYKLRKEIEHKVEILKELKKGGKLTIQSI
ncbi:MAG: hypothetical protein K2O00_01400 [Muribaculaceae bacterium]|nr:hypothetical protein [Muribaculaceae bacterium]